MPAKAGEPPRLAILVPCYNEAEALPRSLAVLENWLAELVRRELVSPDSLLCLVDDGSRDATWEIISAPGGNGVRRLGVRLAGNAGHQNALLAGMLELADQVDCLISIDADLQDDLQAMIPMLALHAEGKDLVYGVRDNRDSDSFIKRLTAGGFYSLMRLLGTPAVPQHADYRLVSRTALAALREYPERNLFLRGIFPSMGLASAVVTYARKERELGTTKYPLRKMLSFAWQGITSFSSSPLRLAGLFGLSAMLLAATLSAWSLWKWAEGITIAGWTSTILVILYLGAAQLLCISLLGEYVAKLYIESKSRPRYLVAERTGEAPVAPEEGGA